MPAITFNADEIFSIAEQIEQNGARFYRKAAENNPGARDLLLKLAKMEDGHYKTFSAMHAQITEAERESISDPDNEAAGYLQAFADGAVFDIKKDPTETLKGNESLKDVLNKAVGLEKDSIVFYLGIRDMISAKQGKEKLEAVIGEEMGHIAYITAFMKGLE